MTTFKQLQEMTAGERETYDIGSERMGIRFLTEIKNLQNGEETIEIVDHLSTMEDFGRLNTMYKREILVEVFNRKTQQWEDKTEIKQ